MFLDTVLFGGAEVVVLDGVDGGDFMRVGFEDGGGVVEVALQEGHLG